MTDHNRIISRSPSEHTTIADVVLDVADDRSLGDRSQGQHVADHEVGLASTVQKLAGVHSLGSNEELLLVLVAERVAEGDAGKRRSTAGIVDDVGDDALEVAVPLAEIEAAEAGRPLAVVGVRLEDGARSLPLGSDDSSHGGGGGG